jgi:hypothetical protein
MEYKHLVHYGNDCMIYKTVALLQISSQYVVVILTKYEGGMWGSDSVDTTTIPFKTLTEAKRHYDLME